MEEHAARVIIFLRRCRLDFRAQSVDVGCEISEPASLRRIDAGHDEHGASLGDGRVRTTVRNTPELTRSVKARSLMGRRQTRAFYDPR